MARPTEVVLTRFIEKVEKTDSCWNWKGFIFPTGYGYFYHSKNSHLAHRTSYKLFRGEIPKGLTIDHLCKNRKCVNPSHLEPVTLTENLLRSDSMGKINGSKTHCKHGHPFSGKNLYYYEKKITETRTLRMRKCRTCERERSRRLYKKLKNI